MNLTVSGRHFEITPPIRDYVEQKLARVKRHFDHVIDLHVILSVEKATQKAEVELHVRGKDLFCAVEGSDMYAAIDTLADKLDRQVLRHKEKMVEPRHTDTPIKHRGGE
jgi:putative sigma-54 modulation protein